MTPQRRLTGVIDGAGAGDAETVPGGAGRSLSRRVGGIVAVVWSAVVGVDVGRSRTVAMAITFLAGLLCEPF
jgi:hypothetical protein